MCSRGSIPGGQQQRTVIGKESEVRIVEIVITKPRALSFGYSYKKIKSHRFALRKSFITVSSLVTQTVKNLHAMQEAWVRSLGQKIPWRREWKPIPVFLRGEFHGQRSPVGHSPWGRNKSDVVE